MGMARNKTLGAQLHMMFNMPVKYYDCGCYTFGLTHNKRVGQTEGWMSTNLYAPLH
jgi:hypothetical protein